MTGPRWRRIEDSRNVRYRLPVTQSEQKTHACFSSLLNVVQCAAHWGSREFRD